MAWFALRPSSRIPVPALLVAASPAIAYHASAGLGTTLVAGLLAVWAWRWIEDSGQQRSRVLPALALGLACLARAEAVLFAIPYAIHELRRKDRLAPAVALLPIAAWTVFRLAYYGALLPVTYHVKKLPFLVDLGFGLRYLARSTGTTGIGIAVLIGAAVLLRPGRRPPALVPIALGLLASTLFVVYVGGDYMNLARFFVPVLPLAILLAADVAAGWLPSVVLGTTVVSACLAFLQWPRQERADVFKYQEQLEQRWIRVGQALRRAVKPDRTVAVGAVGAIGYFSGLRIVDRLGMTNDAILRAAPDLSVEMKGHHRFDSAWVLSKRPDIVLIGSGLFAEGTDSLVAFPPDRQMLAEPGFRSSYRPMAIEVAESYPLIFFLREGSDVPLGARAVQQR